MAGGDGGTDVDPHVARVRVYPVKSLDGLDRARASVLADGGLELDRAYAVVDADTERPESVGASGDYVNGKREPAVHGVDASFDPDAGDDTVVLRDRSGGLSAGTFALAADGGRDAAADWLSAYYGYPVRIVHDGTGGYPDDTVASGPTVVSTATLREVGSWFGLGTEEVRRRFRPTLEIGGVPAFWEERLYADRERVVRFRAGDAALLGTNPCSRCAVPTRDSRTGEADDGFRERFLEKREATLPAWAARDWFDHHYRLAVNTAVPEASVGATLEVGDPVAVLGVEDGNPQS